MPTITTKSYGSRLKDSISGVFFGFILLIAGIVLLFWNEGRTVKTTKMLKEVEKVCVHVEDISTPDSELNGQLVHMNGKAETDEVLSDPTFGVTTIVPAVKFSSKVEYYQYIENAHEETKDKVGGGQETVTTYTYEKTWVSSPVNSAEFHETNHPSNDRAVVMTPSAIDLTASKVSFGAYTLPSALKSQIDDYEVFGIQVDEAVSARINGEAQKLYSDPEGDYFHVLNNVIYLGRNSANPEIGDCRITYTRVLPCEVSLIAKVNGSTFESYTAKNGKSFETLYTGTHSKDEMIASEKAGNKAMCWALRFLGLLLLFIGFKCIFGILDTIAKVVPFLSSLVSLGTGLVSVVLALSLGLIVIAVAWIFYRPVLGIILLAAAIALIWYFTKKGKEKKAEEV